MKVLFEIKLSRKVRKDNFLNVVRTGNLQSGISADCHPHSIPGNAPVHPSILFLFAVHRSEKKQRTSRQQNPMRFVINWWCSDGFTILKPFYCRFGPTLGLAIQRNWFVFRHDYVGGVFGDAGWTVLSWK